MKVLVFTLQMKTSSISAKQCIQAIDSSAPISEPLEGYNGILYLCILTKESFSTLQQTLQKTVAKIYREPNEMTLEESSYRADWRVQWQFGSSPIVTE